MSIIQIDEENKYHLKDLKEACKKYTDLTGKLLSSRPNTQNLKPSASTTKR